MVCLYVPYHFHSKNFKWNHISGECINDGLDYWNSGLHTFALVFIISQVGTNSGMEHWTGLLRGVVKPGVGWPYWCTPGFLNLILCGCLCVCLPLSILITSDVICIPYDWLNKFYSCYVAAVVSIISRRGLSTDAHHKNQPNKCKLALYKLSIHFNDRARQNTSTIKVGVP